MNANVRTTAFESPNDHVSREGQVLMEGKAVVPPLPIRGDFHFHTSYSFDTKIEISEAIDRCLEVGLNCVAVTDHDTLDGAYEMAARAPFRVIIGEEVSTSGGHVIGLFLKEFVPAGLSVVETIDRIKAQGGLAIAPHPFSRIAGESLHDEFVKNYERFDAVEVFNSNSFLRSDDRRALRFAEEHGIAQIAGSDTHRLCGIGSNIVEMPDFSTPWEFVEALPKARIYNRVHPLRYFVDMLPWVAGQKVRLYPRTPEEAERMGFGPFAKRAERCG